MKLLFSGFSTFLILIGMMHSLSAAEFKDDRFYLTIDAKNLHIYDGLLRETRIKNVESDGNEQAKYESFALGKFQYSSSLTAYLTKATSCYGRPNEISLTLVDTSTRKPITNHIIADYCADGDVTSESESWLLDINGDGNLDIVIKSAVTHPPNFGQEPAPGYDVTCDLTTSIFLFSPETMKFVKSDKVNSSSTRNLVMKLGKYSESNICIKYASKKLVR